ncbi:LytR C-terminal domain-containing protein [Fusobacterium varium]|uniref:LytR C-terminal domain-containing protein n=1 Tax=Fusobacterium varium TaxID=856 RepID=UPI001F2066EF|nr:LytR C-terminal domain-containing protein [Fusobacterium varium]MCF2673582.1 LytR C-terminal domain-containing protein [Fusobacterium varium]
MSKGLGKLKLIIFVIGIIIALTVFLFINMNDGNRDLDKNSRYLIIGKNNLIAVYEDKLAVKIPYEISISKDETVEELVKNKNKEEIMAAVNRILPEKVDNYKVIKFGDIKLNVKNAKNIPETNIGDKRYILTSSLYSMFDSLYTDTNRANEVNENIIVDILNANGRAGYARKTGETLRKNLSMKYNAANYETFLEESYVIMNDISKEKTQEVLMQLDEKYFKIKDVPSIPTLANVVVVLGKEQNVDFNLEIVGNTSKADEIGKELKKLGYKNIKNIKNDSKVENSVIEYNSEDYFIAYKIAQKLDIKDMIEKDNLKNKIIIFAK